MLRIAVAKPLRTLFDYALPATLPVPPIGARVRVPFGHGSEVGICIQHSDTTTTPAAKLKSVTATIDATPILCAELVELALWLANYYHHPIGEVCRLLLPAGARRGDPLRIAACSVWSLPAEALADTTEEIPATLGRAKKQQQLWRKLRAQPLGASTAELKAAGFSQQIIKALDAKGLIEQRQLAPQRTLINVAPVGLQLTAEQRTALAAITAQLDAFATHLLYGITGSGKTEIYLQAMALVLAAERQVLLLVPEIALTPQTLQRFRNRFGAAAALHSQIGDAARLQTWLRCGAGLEPILIGTRSAILTPLPKLGLIIVDEEHDPSYKQSDGLRYSARDLAVKRARDLNIPIILGSATPSLESLHNVATGRYQQSLLTQRPAGARLPRMHVLDIRGLQLHEGLAPELLNEIKRHLQLGNQVLVFLNRRGFAPTYMCLGCQWQASCRHCDARLTLHQIGAQRGQMSAGELRCHHCGAKASVPSACPECSSKALIAVGAGTQRTEAALAECFPKTPLIRIDRDNTRSARRLQAQLAVINTGAAALLVGTQMLAKGHHFPAVTLVAILDADSGFLAADYRAPERTAALITQVAGRAGRAARPGEVIIQSLHPTNGVLNALIDGGYSAFAQIELANRAAGRLPPYVPIALVRADGLVPTEAQNLLSELTLDLSADPKIDVLGPAPAPLGRVAGRFRFQSMILAADRASLHRGLARLVRAAPASRHGKLSWSLDVDPYDTY